MNLTKSIAAISLCALSASAFSDPSVRMNGFVTAGLSITDSEVPYAGVSDNLDFGDVSKLGLQFIYDPDIEVPVTFTAQLLTKGRDNWDVVAEWAYVTYRPTDNLTIQAGKILAPFFMLSQSVNVGVTYPWSTPPEEVYGSTNIPFTSIGGIEIGYNGDIGDYEYMVSLYTGEGDFSVPASGLVVDVEMQRSTGIVLELTNDYGMLRASFHDIEYSDNISDVAPIPLPSTTDGEVFFSSVGAKFDWNNIFFMSEYAKRDISNSEFPTTDTWYVTAGYRINKYLPTITYSEIETSDSPLNQSQNTLMLALEVTTSASTRLNFDLSSISPDEGSTGLFDTLDATSIDDTIKFTTSFSMVY